MSLLEIDLSKCDQCGMCVAVCPVCTIAANDNGPHALHEENCISCGHCTAVCPQDALTNTKISHLTQATIDCGLLPDPDAVDYLLRTRRSCRNFTSEKVSRELIAKVLNTSHYAPTAANTDGIEFLVIDNPERLTQITLAVVNEIDEFIYNSSPLPEMLTAMIAQFRKHGTDTVLRGAPCLVLSLADKELLPVFRENGRFMIGYAELYAHALGLGCCRAGLIDVCVFSKHKRLLELLQIPADKVLCGAFVLGYPQYEFQRIVDRGKPEITFID